MEFTKGEKKKIEDTMQYIVEDMYDLWKKAQVQSFSFRVRFKGLGDAGSDICIDKNGVSLMTYRYKQIESWLEYETIIVKDKKCFLGKMIKSKLIVPSKNHNLYSALIENYGVIRKGLLEKSNSGVSDKQKCLDSIDEWYNRFRKEAIIEFDSPFQNQQKIEVREEKGKKVGVLDFGDKIIKIVTNGDIVLVNKNEVNEDNYTKRK